MCRLGGGGDLRSDNGDEEYRSIMFLLFHFFVLGNVIRNTRLTGTMGWRKDPVGKLFNMWYTYN